MEWKVVDINSETEHSQNQYKKNVNDINKKQLQKGKVFAILTK